MNKTIMTDFKSASKRRLDNEEDEDDSRDSKRRRHRSTSPNKKISRSSSHSRKHKRRREGRDEKRRSHKQHQHRSKEKSERSSSQVRASKRRSVSPSESRRKHRRSYSRERSSPNNLRFNGRFEYYGERSPRENHVARSYIPSSGYRSRSRSRSRGPHENRYERDTEYSKPYEKEVYDAGPRNSRGFSDLKREIKDLLRIEHHHLVYEGEEDSNGDIQGVEWCYKFLDPSIRGHITGGTAILHHRCRQCSRICLHLLGTYGTGKRMCLACAARERGWREDEVPFWYFHKPGPCQHCRSRQYYKY